MLYADVFDRIGIQLSRRRDFAVPFSKREYPRFYLDTTCMNESAISAENCGVLPFVWLKLALCHSSDFGGRLFLSRSVLAGLLSGS